MLNFKCYISNLPSSYNLYNIKSFSNNSLFYYLPLILKVNIKYIYYNIIVLYLGINIFNIFNILILTYI
jgi:hypothetical protein